MNKNALEKVVESLRRFGLSQEEAELYVNLPQMEALNVENISERTKLNIENVSKIMKSLENKGFVQTYLEGLYVPRTPIEALDRRINALFEQFHDMKKDVIAILQPKFPQETLIACNLDHAHFNILVADLTKKATGTIRIYAKEMKFIEESDFLEALENNKKLHVHSAKILLTANRDTPEWGDIVYRLRELKKSRRVKIRLNPSRTELRYMTVRTKDKRIALLVNSEHKHGVVIECDEVASYFNENFDKYFDEGEDVDGLLGDLKNIKDPKDKDDDVVKILTTTGRI